MSALYAINDLGAGLDFSQNDNSESNSYSTVSFKNAK